MRKLSRFGAAALAMALSLTMLAPVNVKAYGFDDTDTKASDTTVDIDINGTANATNPGKVDQSKPYNKTEKNKATGKYSKEVYDGKDTSYEGDGDVNSMYYVPSAITVEKGEYSVVTIKLGLGNTSISKLKVKKGKANVKVKIAGTEEVKNEDVAIYQDPATKAYYAVDPVTGKRVDCEAGKNTLYKSYGEVTLRIYGNKIGKSVIQFQVNDVNGAKVATKKIKIDVVKDYRAITSATFAGKDLMNMHTTGQKYIYADGSPDGAFYTTKKTGKFKIKTDKNWTVKNIYVLRKIGYASEAYGASSSYKGTHLVEQTTGIDLNGDGDFFDRINGIQETAKSGYTYTKIRNNGKVKLSTVPDSKIADDYYEEQTVDGQPLNKTVKKNYESNMATTTFIVIVQNKRSKEYHSYRFSVMRKIGK